MRTERMRKEGRGTSSADHLPPQGPEQPRMGLHQVGTLMCPFQAAEDSGMPCRDLC